MRRRTREGGREIDRKTESRTLDWLFNTQGKNQFKWAVRQPATWVLIGTISIPACLVLWLITGSPHVAISPSSVPFFELVGWIALLVVMATLCGSTSGLFGLIVLRPMVDVVFPSPIERASIIQWRVKNRLIVTFITGLASAALVAWVITSYHTVPFQVAFLGAFAGLMPGFLNWSFLLTLGMYAGSTLSNRRQNIAAAIVLAALLTVLVAGLPAITLRDGNLRDDPLFVLILNLSIAPTRLVYGLPLEGADVLLLVAGWAVLGLLSAVAIRWRYVVYEDQGSQSVPVRETAQFPIERGYRWEALERLAKKLRPGFVDIGEGWRALLGKNMTMAIRGPAAMMNVLSLAILGFMAAILGGLFSVITLTMLGLMFATITTTLVGGQTVERQSFSLVRLLPLSGRDAYLAHIVPVFVGLLPWALLLLAAAILALAPALFALASISLFLSIGLFAGSLSFLSTLLPELPVASPEAPLPGPGVWAHMGLMMAPLALIFPGFIALNGIVNHGSPHYYVSSQDLLLWLGIVGAALGLGSLAAAIGIRRFHVPPKR